jgi:perosamine synthetase
MSEKKYKEAIASVLNCKPDSVFLYWKGRVALYALLKAMDIKNSDEIILPAFTCVVVPNAIKYLNAKPIYVDISPRNYNMVIDKLEEAITNKTNVIICQNTFGLSSNIEMIVEIAKRHNIFTIEDCTHGFGGYYNGKPNGSYCDAAFYSSQWNKPFSTGIGGFLVINNDELIEKVKRIEKEKKRPGFFNKFVLFSLLLFKKYFVNDYTQQSLTNLFRFLSRHNLVLGSSQGNELTGTEIPENFLRDISSVQIKTGIKQLKNLGKINKLRKKNAAEYTKFLKSKMKLYVDEELFDNHLFLKYPLLVKDRELFFNLALKEKIVLGDWFLSPIHPVKENFEVWDLNIDLYPNAERISRKIVNLPTDIEDNRKVLEFLGKNLDLIE